jgi:hypothetical protein
MPQPHPASPRASRNAPILDAEALFAQRAERIVRLVIARAEGGDPVCLRLCLERALPAGREPPLDLGPVHDRASLKRACGEIGDALAAGRINIRQAMTLLHGLGGDAWRLPMAATVRAYAQAEAELAKAAAAMAQDHGITVAPRARGGMLDPDQTNKETTP